MSYPKLIANKKKLLHNVTTMKKKMTDAGLKTLAGVTKGFSAYPEVAEIFVEGGVDYIADSRVLNLKKLKDLPKKKWLLRIPMMSELEDVLEYADISQHSEYKVLEKLNELAGEKGVTHDIILMVDLGDLREGYFYEDDFFANVEKVLKLENLNFIGIGVNLTCYGAVIPTPEVLGRLDDYKNEIKERFDHDLEIISGGNSSTVYLVGEEDLGSINNLRLGEALLLGTESAYGQNLEYMEQGTWRMEAEIVELKEKPSVPTAKELGRDAFGRIPVFEDRGIRKRAIIGIGKQDVDIEDIKPVDEGIIILGSSSDHTILDITDAKNELEVGDIIPFNVNYGAMLKLSTSPYVTVEVEED